MGARQRLEMRFQARLQVAVPGHLLELEAAFAVGAVIELLEGVEETLDFAELGFRHGITSGGQPESRYACNNICAATRSRRSLRRLCVSPAFHNAASAWTVVNRSSAKLT